MILSLHLDPKFIKALNELRKQGGMSLVAAKKADGLIERLSLKGRECSKDVGRLTRRGELRIRNCKKYDLGNGYRLICLRKASRLFVLFVGTHDECGRWLDRNKGLEYEPTDISQRDIITVLSPPEPPTQLKATVYEDEYEERLRSQTDDKMLRRIFSGLCTK